MPTAPASPTTANIERPRRTSSMTISPSVVSAPQPPVGPQHVEQDLGLTRTSSSVNLDGEPRIFPGVVSRRRRSSLRSSNVEDGEEAHSGLHRVHTEPVVQEQDTDDEDL
jgi:AMP deaminase